MTAAWLKEYKEAKEMQNKKGLRTQLKKQIQEELINSACIIV